jgi:hypothetical protein
MDKVNTEAAKAAIDAYKHGGPTEVTALGKAIDSAIPTQGVGFRLEAKDNKISVYNTTTSEAIKDTVQTTEKAKLTADDIKQAAKLGLQFGDTFLRDHSSKINTQAMDKVDKDIIAAANKALAEGGKDKVAALEHEINQHIPPNSRIELIDPQTKEINKDTNGDITLFNRTLEGSVLTKGAKEGTTQFDKLSDAQVKDAAQLAEGFNEAMKAGDAAKLTALNKQAGDLALAAWKHGGVKEMAALADKVNETTDSLNLALIVSGDKKSILVRNDTGAGN